MIHNMIHNANDIIRAPLDRLEVWGRDQNDIIRALVERTLRAEQERDDAQEALECAEERIAELEAGE